MQPVWYASYEKNVPQAMPAIEYTSLADFFTKICKKFAQKTAFENFGTQLTFQEIDNHSQHLANFLLGELKLNKGDRVAIMMPNLLQYPVGMMGILRAGLVVVNVNPLYTQPELLHTLQDSEAKAIIVWDSAAHIVQAVMNQLPDLQVIPTQLGDLLPSVKNHIMQFVMRYIKRQIPTWKIPTAICFKKALTNGAKLTTLAVKITAEDLAFLQYTGGTTGVPKGAMLTHHNLLANITQVAAWIQNNHKPGNDDILLSPLPFYHIFALLANCLLFMYMGAHNVLITNPRDIPGFIKIMKKYRFNCMTGVNTLFNALLEDPRIKEVDFSQLKTALAGGAALQQVIAEKWQQVTGKVLYEGYGLTETSPAVTVTPMNMQRFNGSAGLPLPSTEIEIRDDKGNALSIDQAGELWVKGPQVMRGYWQRPEETQNVFDANGWLRTGDIAKVDAQGFVYLVDRKKDMILVSGFNVYPNEIEDTVAKMPGVKEVAAIGIPDEHSGEVVKLFIVKKDTNLTEADVLAYCHDNLTGYKRPKMIEFRDSLPKSNVGKILRRALRE